MTLASSGAAEAVTDSEVTEAALEGGAGGRKRSIVERKLKAIGELTLGLRRLKHEGSASSSATEHGAEEAFLKQ